MSLILMAPPADKHPLIAAINDNQEVPIRFSPEQRLCAAMLARAICDALVPRNIGYTNKQTKANGVRNIQKCARTYLMNNDVGPLSFKIISEALSEDPEALRYEVRKLIKNNNDRGCLRAYGFSPNFPSEVKNIIDEEL